MRLGRKKAKNNGTFLVLIYSRYHDTSDTRCSFFFFFSLFILLYASSPAVFRRVCDVFPRRIRTFGYASF